MGALVTAAEEIRDETTPSANTAERVGEALVNQAQAIENSGQPQIYVATISQEGTAAPVALSEFSTMGAMQYSYDEVGFYILQSENGAVPIGATAFGFGSVITDGSAGFISFSSVTVNGQGRIIAEIAVKDIDLNNFNSFPQANIKIEVYP